MKTILYFLILVALSLGAFGQPSVIEATPDQVIAGTATLPFVITPRRLVGGGGGQGSNNTWTGSNGFSGPLFRIPTPMVSTSIDITKSALNRTLTASETENFSGTPLGNYTIVIRYTATGGPWTVTYGSGVYSYGRQGDISGTGIVIPANGTYAVSLTYSLASSRWEMSGDPVLVTGTGSFSLSDTPTFTTKVFLNTSDTTQTRGFNQTQYTSDTLSSVLNLRKARGTVGSPTVITVGDNLGRITAWGYDGSNFINSGSIVFQSVGTIASTRVGSSLQFFTGTDVAPTVLTLALTLDQNQKATFAGQVITPATTSSGSGLLLPHGTAPSSPVNGAVWTTTAGVYSQINSVTVGPFAQAVGSPTVLTDAASITSTCVSYLANQNWKVTLGGNRTLATPTSIAAGMYGTLAVTQDGTGTRTLALWSGSKVINGGGGVIVLSTAAAAVDVLTWYYDGTNTYWTYGKNFN